QTLTFNGGAFSGGDITGQASGGTVSGGVVATTGTVSENDGVVGTGATWLVKGTVNQANDSLYLDDGSSGTLFGGTLSIAATGVFDLTDDNGIGDDAGVEGFVEGLVVNAGVLEKTGGTNVSQ